MKAPVATSAHFLEINGCHFIAIEVDVVLRTRLAAGEMTESEFSARLNGNSKRAS